MPENKTGGKKILFTLIELLIVISIIAVLAEMIWQALNLFREKSRSISCLNSLKQLGTSSFIYSEDFKGWMPRAYESSSNLFYAQRLIQEKYLPNTKVMVCPSFMPYRFNGNYGMTYGARSRYDTNIFRNPVILYAGGIEYAQVSPALYPIYLDSVRQTGSSLAQHYHLTGGTSYVSTDGGVANAAHAAKRVNMTFADGHAAALDEGGMKASKVRYYFNRKNMKMVTTY